MKVKNVSARLHHVGNVSIAPGEEKDIPKGFETAINKDELVEVKPAAPAPAPTAAEKAAAAKKAADIKAAESKLASAKTGGNADAIAAAEAALAELTA